MNLIQNFSLINTMALMRLKADAKKMVLSYIWWALEPLLFAGMFYLVFTYLRASTQESFFLFLMLGKIPYLWFSKSVLAASNSITANKGLICSRPIAKWVFPLVSIQESTYKQLVSFSVLILLVVANGYYHPAFWWQLLPLVLIQYVLICGAGMICAVFVTYAKDFGMLIGMGMMGLMFSSGIFWDLNQIQDAYIRELIFTYNPLAALIDAYRQVLMQGSLVNWNKMVPAMLISTALLVLGAASLNKLNNSLTRRLFV